MQAIIHDWKHIDNKDKVKQLECLIQENNKQIKGAQDFLDTRQEPFTSRDEIHNRISQWEQNNFAINELINLINFISENGR